MQSFRYLGISVSALTKHDLVELVAKAVENCIRYVIGNHNLHSIYMASAEPRMREFYQQVDFAHVDGMPLIWAGRLLGLPLSRKDRTGYMDLLPLLAQRASISGWKIFYLGSKPGIAEKGANILRAQYPALQLQTGHGYFDSARNAQQNVEILAEIKRFDPNILLVGMGMPRQECWILDNLDRIRTNAVFCCGALMDYVAGEIPTPPRWLGQLGLEWLFRLISEPRRLWRRYLLEPWFVFTLLARELVGQGRNGAEASSNGDRVDELAEADEKC
jgi:N-acetylglucosaminyldiphosphoundecaprenol N-acetyl-beta-D-mannosaminyltransferase